MPPSLWTTAGRPVLESALAVVLAVALAQLGLASLSSRGMTGAPFAEGPLAAPEFVARALSTQAGLLVASALVFLARPGRVPLRMTRRAGLWSIFGLVVLFAINLATSWGMARAGEGYLGFPQLPAGILGIAVFVLGAISAPLAEELFFREALLCRVLASSPRPLAIAVSAFLFGGLHLDLGGPLLLAGLTSMGAVLAIVRVRSGSLGAAIAAHAAHNLAALALGAGREV